MLIDLKRKGRIEFVRLMGSAVRVQGDAEFVAGASHMTGLDVSKERGAS